jgi:hypothetical protein
MLYRTLIQPYFEYCNIIWAAESTGALNDLYLKQKRAIRAITFSKWNAHTKPIFYKLKLLPVYDINKLQVYCFVHKAINGNLPDQFNCLFSLNSSVHDHHTRQSSQIHIIHSRIRARRYSIKIHGSRLWNSLDKNIINSPSFNIFKKQCKAHLVLALEQSMST